jgi:hypothetical protein
MGGAGAALLHRTASKTASIAQATSIVIARRNKRMGQRKEGRMGGGGAALLHKTASKTASIAQVTSTARAREV